MILDYHTFHDLAALVDEEMLWSLHDEQLRNEAVLLKQLKGLRPPMDSDPPSKQLLRCPEEIASEVKLYYVLSGVLGFLASQSSKSAANPCKELKEQLRNVVGTLPPRIARIYLGYQAYKAWLASLDEEEPPATEHAPIFLDVAIPEDPRKIKLLVPMVPIKSIFSIYLASIITDVMRQLFQALSNSELDSLLEVAIGWNEIAYRNLQQKLEAHLKFDEGLSYERLRVWCENSFLSFLYNVLYQSSWDRSRHLQPQDKYSILHNVVKTRRYEKKTQTGNLAHMAGKYAKDKSVDDIVLQEIEHYVFHETPNIIEYFMDLLVEELTDSEEGELLVLLTALPIGLTLDHALEQMDNANRDLPSEVGQSLRHLKERCRLLCYVPFPGSEGLRDELPFYITEYSYLLYERKTRGSDVPETIEMQRKFVRRILIGSLARLGLPSPAFEALHEKNLEELKILVTDEMFRREDNRQKEYLKYV